MKTSSHDHLQGIFSQKGSALQKIFSNYQAHQRLSKIFERDRPANYKNQLHFLLYQAGVMTLSVNNSAAYSRINYQKDELLSHFKKQTEWAGLREIRLKLITPDLREFTKKNS